ncbi:hypothetical protein JCGZ_01561 [Jatropha curcas]|uniref:AT3G52170-like helix-turn-helix domain-containing protein n=1 Tax=Jatropha curcas TaxID=180498 RepID=A0A067L9C3_JATCU|nr:uncharacterized protein LOC105648523 [Jatropha curcas]KDP45061.1 hypothetical protein JCGZ_01561 [Jatropha curcas]
MLCPFSSFSDSFFKNYQVCMLRGGGGVWIMHAIKGGWARQTYALAKSNESAGRKTRVRRSKEERKEMVESFIKKYQSLNNGNFPSLRLTHKEVGGSFYTVREIVREIIQENRVLGPAKSLPFEQNADQLLEESPLGTISTHPGSSFSISTNGSPSESDQLLDTGEELYLISDRHYAKPEQLGFDNEQVINGRPVIVTNVEFDEINVAKAEVSEAKEPKKNAEEVAATRTEVTQMADVIVETFPLRPVTQLPDNLDETFSTLRDLSGTLVEKDVEKVPLGPGSVASNPDGMNLSNNSCLVDDKEEEKLAGPSLEGGSSLVNEKALETAADLPSGSSNLIATKDCVVHDTQVAIDVEVKSSHNDKAIAETKVFNAPNGTQTGSLNGNYGSINSSETVSQEEVTNNNKANVQPSGSSQKANNPKLDRINLKSWEGDSKKHAETNPLWGTIKSFVDAFVKFWS